MKLPRTKPEMKKMTLPNAKLQHPSVTSCNSSKKNTCIHVGNAGKCIAHKKCRNKEAVQNNNTEGLSDESNSHTEEQPAKAVLMSTKDISSKIKNRKLPCYFCDKRMFHMTRHLCCEHENDVAVAEAALSISNAKEKKMNLQIIVNQEFTNTTSSFWIIKMEF